MCGVIGIIADRDIAPELYYGMCALQHRGQDAAGMLTFNGGPKLKKGSGKVTDVFSADDIRRLHGNIGIAHTRYPTASSNNLNEDAHPFLVYASKRIGMVHNGNLTNYYEMREKVKKRGVFLDTENDVELMVKIFAYEYENSSDAFHAVKQLMQNVKGAYSVICGIEDVGLLAFRDPNGIRPLMLGKNEHGYCVASESIAFQQLGYERIRDLEPGEAVLIHVDGTLTAEIIDQREHRPCMFEWIYFARPDSMIDDRAVYNARLKLGFELAQQFKHEVDVVIPVPDTARTAAMKFAETLNVKHREGLIKNRYSLRTFIMPTQSSRETEVNIKLNPIISVIEGQRVAVVDDSIVRGTTSRRIVSLLRKAGAKEVHFLSTCPPITNPCFYGVDMPTKEELIASDKNVEEIRKFIDADSLTYLSLDGLKSALKKENPCMACLTGEYPVPVESKEMALVATSRTNARKC